METVFVVGMGPGSTDHLTRAARDAIERADVLVGAERHLRPYEGQGKRCIPITGNFGELVSRIEEKSRTHAVAVLVSGDPGFHSYLRILSRSISPERLEVIPGISSVQFAFARLALPWQEAVLVSAHGKSAEAAFAAVRAGALTAILTDRVNLPATLVRRFLAAGVSGTRRAWIAENLSYPEERILSGTLAELRDADAGSLSILIVASEEDSMKEASDG